jgi:hypothetical protein
MNEPQTQTNGTQAAAKVKEPTCLEPSLALFKARKNPATTKEILAATQAYMKVQDEMDKAQAVVDELKIKRTAATQSLVALRGPSRMNTKSRGVGNITGRADTAWIAFLSSAEGEEIEA